MAVEIEQTGRLNTLLAIDEWENTMVSGKGKNGTGAERFSEYLAAFIKVNQVKSRRASVALDTANLFFNTLPLEASLSRTAINDHINWELSQYHPDAGPREFITDFHTIARHQNEGWNEVLSVSVRRESVYTVQKLLTQLGLSLHIVDADHFSAEHALRSNYPDTSGKYLALVGVKENRLDISFIRHGVMESYQYHLVSSNAEIAERIGTLSRETRGMYSITVYGPFLDNDLLVQIRRASGLLVEALNPLRHVRISDSLRIADHLATPSYRFASAIGVALRRE